jgi:RNA polymerase sigma-70 factor (ECF subfamily)
VIARAMRNLPHRFRRLLVLREFEGLSYRELANALEIPVGTVMSRLSRARQALRDALGSEANPSLVGEYSNTSGS